MYGNADVMPAGSLPPENQEIPVNTTPGVTDINVDTNAAQPQTKQEEPILGKFKDVNELINGYKEIERKFGTQGAELGGLRKQVEVLSHAVKNTANNNPVQQSQQNPDNSIVNIDNQIRDIATKADNGEIASGEAVRLSAELASKKALLMSQQYFGQQMQQVQVQNAERDFVSQNPDFPQALESGALEEIKRTNPLHDNLSAYYAYKSMQLQQQAEVDKKSAYNAGMAEGSKLKDGAIPAGKVLSKPGGSVRQTNPQGPLTGKALQDGMMGVLQQLQQGGVGG